MQKNTIDFELGKCYRHIAGIETKVVEQVKTDTYGPVFICENASGAKLVFDTNESQYSMYWEEITTREYDTHKIIYKTLCKISDEHVEWDLNQIIEAGKILTSILNEDHDEDDESSYDDNDDEDYISNGGESKHIDESDTQTLPLDFIRFRRCGNPMDKSIRDSICKDIPMIVKQIAEILEKSIQATNPSSVDETDSFRVGKYYRHTSGRRIQIVTLVGRDYIIIKNNQDNNNLGARMSVDTPIEGWIEISENEWENNFSDTVDIPDELDLSKINIDGTPQTKQFQVGQCYQHTSGKQICIIAIPPHNRIHVKTDCGSRATIKISNEWINDWTEIPKSEWRDKFPFPEVMDKADESNLPEINTRDITRFEQFHTGKYYQHVSGLQLQVISIMADGNWIIVRTNKGDTQLICKPVGVDIADWVEIDKSEWEDKSNG